MIGEKRPRSVLPPDVNTMYSADLWNGFRDGFDQVTRIDARWNGFDENVPERPDDRNSLDGNDHDHDESQRRIDVLQPGVGRVAMLILVGNELIQEARE